MTVPFALAFLALQTGGGGRNAWLGPLFMYGSIFAIFYFIWLRPQQRQRRQHEERLRNLKRGDEIVTSGGIIGEIVHIKEAMKDGKPERTMDDRVTIKSAESRLVVERGRIARVITAEAPAPSPSTKKE